MKQRALLIFDLDGTLFHTEKVSIPAVQGALHAAGYAEPSPETIIGFFGRPYQEFFDWLNATYPGLSPEVAASIDEWELKMVRERGALYPGVLEMLAELRPAVGPMAICTNGPRPYTELVVKHHGLAPFFDVVRWRRGGDGSKADMVRSVLAQLRPGCGGRPAGSPLRADVGAVIGDRRDDVEAAHENGLLAIASGYGYGSEEELAGAEAVAQSPADLPRLIAALLEGKA